MLAMKMVELWIQTSLVYASSKWLKQSRGQEPWAAGKVKVLR